MPQTAWQKRQKDLCVSTMSSDSRGARRGVHHPPPFYAPAVHPVKGLCRKHVSARDDAVQDFAAHDAIVGAELKSLGDSVLLAVGDAIIDDRQLARLPV